jgi:hypothetical protein
MTPGEAIFVSYSRKDFYFAESLVSHLELRGVRVWFDARNLQPGEFWDREIDAAIDSARWWFRPKSSIGLTCAPSGSVRKGKTSASCWPCFVACGCRESWRTAKWWIFAARSPLPWRA